MDSHSYRRLSDPRERVITIANQIRRDLVPGKRLAELLGGPRRRGMGGDRHVAREPAARSSGMVMIEDSSTTVCP